MALLRPSSLFFTLLPALVVGGCAQVSGKQSPKPVDAGGLDVGGSAGGGSGGGGSGGAAGGGGVPGTGGAGGQPDAGPASRCGFPAGAGGVVPGPATEEVVLRRIVRFLDGSSTLPAGITASPTTLATPSWAAGIATRILDDHLANGTDAPGLVRFLSGWLKLTTDLTPARTWARTLLDPNATLTTLFAGPTNDPRRKGIFTDQVVLTLRTRITTRGSWFSEKVFCAGTIPPDPPGIVTVPPPPGSTRRQALAASLAVSSLCMMSCHNITDPVGFSLEHFDELGAYRDLDSGKPVDSAGMLLAPLPSLSFDSINDLAPQLATSCPVAYCFTSVLMTDAFAAGSAAQPAALTFLKQEIDQVANAFANSNFSIRELVKAIVGQSSFLRTM